MKSRSFYFLMILFMMFMIPACGGSDHSNDQGTQEISVVPPSVEKPYSPSPLEAAPTGENITASEIERELTLKILSSMTGTDTVAIEQLATEFGVQIPLEGLDQKTILFIEAMDPQTQSLSEKMQGDNYHFLVAEDNSYAESFLVTGAMLKARIVSLIRACPKLVKI